MSYLRWDEAVWGIWGIVWFALSWNVAKTIRQQSCSSRAIYVATLATAFSLLFWPAPAGGVLDLRLWPVGPAVGLAGVLVTLTGLLFACWARLHLGRYWSGTVTLKEGHRLIRTGPYRFVRHPIYTGFLLGYVGAALVAGEVRGLVAILLMSMAHARKMQLEEDGLASIFPDEYATYRTEVKRLIPFVY